MNAGLIKDTGEAATVPPRPYITATTPPRMDGKTVVDIQNTRRQLRAQREQINRLFDEHDKYLAETESAAKAFISAINNTLFERI